MERLRKTHTGSNPGRVHIEMGYLVSTDAQSWLRPDVSLTHAEQGGDRYYQGAPQIAFEVVSGHDSAVQLEAKVGEYLENGGVEVWVIYPDTRHAWVYQRSTTAARRETKSIHSELLQGIEIAPDDIL